LINLILSIEEGNIICKFYSLNLFEDIVNLLTKITSNYDKTA